MRERGGKTTSQVSIGYSRTVKKQFKQKIQLLVIIEIWEPCITKELKQVSADNHLQIESNR